MTKRNDPDELAALLNAEANGANAAQAPEGMKLAPLHEAGIFVPRSAKPNQALHLVPFRGENVVDFAARRRLYASMRMPVPDDTAVGRVIFEERASANDQYARESMETEWIKTGKPEGERFTLRWRKMTDDLGTWWVTPSGKIMLNAAYYTPPAPQAPLAPIVEKIQDRGELVYKPLRRGS